MEEEYRSIYQQNQQKTFKVILMKSHEFFPNYDKPGKRDLEPARQCSAMRRKQLTVKYVSLPLAHNCAQHRALNSKVRKILLFWDINFIVTLMSVYHCHKLVLLGKWPLLQVCY